jgi:CheY-like chemotaxis protein
MAGPEPADLCGTRVLVVDDDADSCEMLATVLMHSGAQVETAQSAAAALTAFERTRPHIVISDIGLPDEDGFSLLRRLRGLPSGGDIPAIALTGYESSEDRALMNGKGFQAQLTKPVELNVMLATIAQVLQPRRPDPA